MTRPLAIQMCPFSPELERSLAQRFEIKRWYDAADDSWLAVNGAAVRAVITGGHIGISNQLMDRLPGLGIVAINGVGFDKVDLEYVRARGVRVSITPDVLTDDVADLAVGLVIALLRGAVAGDAFVRSGQWLAGGMPLGRKVTGRRFGIVGLGRIGQAIASRLAAFGPLAYTDLQRKAVPYRFEPDLMALAADSDVLILSSAANATTNKLIDARVLTALGPEGFLVNVARGSLVDEPALITALAKKQIAGAALDVFADEPRVPQELRDMPNVVLTPHIASATAETRANMASLVLANLDAQLAGTTLPGALV